MVTTVYMNSSFRLPLVCAALFACSSSPSGRADGDPLSAAPGTERGSQTGPTAGPGAGGESAADGGTDSGAEAMLEADTCGALDPAWTDGGVVYDLGHGSIAGLAVVGDIAISSSNSGGWIRWNTKTKKILDRSPMIGFQTAGGRFLSYDKGYTRIEVRDIATNAVLGSFPTAVGRDFRLVNGADYLVAKDKLNIEAYSFTGQLLVARAGNYERARVFGTASELRVAAGGAGANVIETIPLNGAPSTISAPFFGNFVAWTDDGTRFLSGNLPDLLVYSKESVLEQTIKGAGVTPDQPAGGFGKYVWVSSTGLIGVWELGTNGPPMKFGGNIRSRLVQSSGRHVLGGGEVIDLGVSPPARTSVATTSNWYTDEFAADDAGNFLLAYSGGAVRTGSITKGEGPFLSCGGALSVSGATNGKAAILTTSGYVIVLDTVSKTAVTHYSPGHFADLSDDSSTLMVNDPIHALTTFVLPGFTKRGSSTPPRAGDARLSPTGAQVGELDFLAGGWRVRDSSFASPVASGTSGAVGVLAYREALVFSPDETHFAVLMSTASTRTVASSRIYKAGTFNANALGAPLVWLSNDRLLTSDGIYDAAGMKVGAAYLPPNARETVVARRVTASSVLFPRENVIIDQTTGRTVWSGGPTAGASVSGHVVAYPRESSGAIAGKMVVWSSSEGSGGIRMKAYGVVP